MKSYYNIARAISNCWGISGYNLEVGDFHKADVYEKTIKKLLALAKERDTPRTCGSCRYWWHKSSTEKNWGRCTNEKVRGSTYITFRISPDSEIRFEENTFGCIHHRGMK